LAVFPNPALLAKNLGRFRAHVRHGARGHCFAWTAACSRLRGRRIPPNVAPPAGAILRLSD
jgi:hypothetical protein